MDFPRGIQSLSNLRRGGSLQEEAFPAVLGGMYASVMPEDDLLPEKKFCMQSYVLLAENDGLFSLAAKVGCIGVFVRIESVSDDTPSAANKGFKRVHRLRNNITRCHDCGIMVDKGNIFGFDTPDVFDRTIEALEKSGSTALPSTSSSLTRGPNSTGNLKKKAGSSAPTLRNTPAAQSS
jgi:hypothetical protein